jgi:hypothetical protein
MPAWTPLPILVLSPPGVNIRAIDVRRISAAAFSLPLVMVLAAPVIAVAMHYAGVSSSEAHARLLAAKTESAWHEATTQPLRLVGCNFANEVVAYAKDRPRALPACSFRGDIADQMYADAYGWPRTPCEPALSDAQLARSGMALVCSVDEANWVHAAEQWTAHYAASRRIDVEVTRNFLGITDQGQRYAIIFIIPPQQ